LGDAIIRFQDVKKSFGAQRVLDGLSLEVGKGRTLGIMGASGSGKSVALRHAIGLMKPDSGSVQIDGLEVPSLSRAALSDLRRRMGYVFQEGALINWLSVGENVALPLRENTPLRDAEIRDRVRQKLELVHIPDAWEKMPSQISGGMKKRVGIARALINEPEIILYDEPNAGLDPEISRSINETIRELKEQLHVTSIVVEHRVECIRVVADEVIFLEAGKALVRLPTDEFFTTDHPRIREFLGQDPNRSSISSRETRP